MKKEEQTVKPDMRTAEKSRKHHLPKNSKEATERAAEMPGKEAGIAAEMKNRRK